MWHTLAQAIQLTGRSRRSLYRDMGAGRVSYRVRSDGRRELETSELMRAYGALMPVAHEPAQMTAQVGTPYDEQFQALIDELRQLRSEVRELRETLMLLEHKPAVPSATETSREPFRQSRPAASFADLIAELDDLS